MGVVYNLRLTPKGMSRKFAKTVETNLFLLQA